MKKKCLLVTAWVLLTLAVHSQSIAINTDGSSPNANSILDIKSGNKGLLIPRMNSAARNAIPNTQGLMVYDTTTNSFWYNTGTKWQTMIAPAALSSLAIADSAWLLSGNGNTVDKVSFLGTTNRMPLNIRVNNEPAGRIDPFRGNTSWGYHADYSDTSGFDNTALGAFAFQATTSGNYNVAIGNHTMYANTSGGYNTAVGVAALSLNTIGKNNVSIGYQSLFNNTIGIYNTAVGFQSLLTNTTGSNNTAIGFQTLLAATSPQSLTAIGSQALKANTTGTDNTATGYTSLLTNTTGSRNTGNGSGALYFNSTGSFNTASGFAAMFFNTTGGLNTATGSGCLNANTTGNFNTASGAFSLGPNTTGSENTATGYRALAINATGDANTAVGDSALWNNYTGSYNTAIGRSAIVGSGGLNNATAVGFGAIVDASNKVRIGNSAVTVIEGQVPFTTPSDGRYKFNIHEDVKGLDFILNLRPVTYQFDVKRFDAQLNHQTNKTGGPANYAIQTAYDEASRIRRSGFIAQEVEQAAKTSGYDFSGIIAPKTEEDHYSLSYDAFVVPLVKSIQEQQQIILRQNKKLEEQDKKMANLQQQLDEIKKLLQHAN